jgi:transposase
MISHFKDKGLLKSKGKQRTDSTHVLAKIRTLNRLELVAETMIHTLNVLATVVPDWLKEWVPGEWYDQYEKQIDEYRLPQEETERTLFAETIGTDGHLVLKMIYSQAPDWFSSIPAIETMRRIWVQQYYIQEGKVNWRTKSNLPPPAAMISSPHDTDARYSRKRETTWVGYKVHLTESCDQDVPHSAYHCGH